MSRNKNLNGSLLGLAVGDALGTTLEFTSPGSFESISDIIGGGPFSLKPGEWTDDTSMALCLADSIVNANGFDADSQMKNYVRWYKEGFLSSNGRCFDIGMTVRSALEDYVNTGNPNSGSTDPMTAGNGSLMRLAPIPMAFYGDFEQTVHYAAKSSKTTHGAPEAVDACRFYAGLIHGALAGESKKTLVSASYTPIPGYWDKNPLSLKIQEIAEGSYLSKNPPAIRGTGYVVQSMEAALWAFANSDSFKEGALLAVNLGEDADTTGAIYGQLAGAYYGLEGIPGEWTEKVAHKDLILEYAEKLYNLNKQLVQH